MGGLGEVTFIEIIEFDPSFKGLLTCVWRKGSGEVKGGSYSFISSFSRFIYYVLATVIEWKKDNLFCPYGAYFSSGRRWEDSKQVNITWKISCQEVVFCEDNQGQEIVEG